MNLIEPTDLLSGDRFDTKQAISYQKEWTKLIKNEDCFAEIKTIAGLDIAYDYPSNRAFAVAVLLDAQTLAPLEIQRASTLIQIPYRPGFLSFREVPALRPALEQLSTKPDLIVCDGQGIAHPRRFGLACHLGLIYDLPAIGCGKSRLYGQAKEPGKNRGDFAYLYGKPEEIIGSVLRTRNQVKPVYVSVGHKISLESACEWVLRLTPKYRLPETTRLADRLAKEYKLSILASPPAAG